MSFFNLMFISIKSSFLLVKTLVKLDLLQLTSEIFGFVHGLWTRDLDLFAELSLVHSENMGPAMDRANLSCKSIALFNCLQNNKFMFNVVFHTVIEFFNEKPDSSDFFLYVLFQSLESRQRTEPKILHPTRICLAF